MQNKKYIKFANKNTVEVLSFSGLDVAIKKKEPKSGTYVKKDAAGQEVEYMVEWPSLTFDQIMKLRSSKASRYNDSGFVPYTCLLDPYSLERMHVFKDVTSKSIMEEVKIATKTLQKAHGKGIKRETIHKINSALAKSASLSNKGDWDSGFKVIGKVAPKPQDLPESLRMKVKEAKEALVASARARLDEIMEMESKDAKRAIGRFMGKAKTTGLVDEAREFLKSLKDS